jgi:alkaline phosphatase D
VPGTPTSFRFALGACARETNSPVFRAAIQQGAAFFLHTGDFHYADIKRNRIRLFRDAFDAHLSAPSLRTMLEKIPLIYQWDDHDFGPNNSNRNSPSREMSRTTYRQLVPHYPLVFGAAGPKDQAFTVGRVRFLLSDLRSERNPNTRRMMSEDQDAWLKAELLHAKGKYPLIFWISSVPWNGEPNTSDRWQGYGRHRAEIAQFIKANGIPGVCILAGDAHMVAIDDGSNSDFAEGGGAPIRVFQAAPIANRGSYKGGPYSHGARAEGPERMLYQFGLVDVQDDGHTIQVAWSARNGSDGFGARVVTATKWGSGPIELTFSVQ